MFFLKSRKQRAELQDYLHQISDMLNPQGAVVEQEMRSASRKARIYPAMLAPWEEGDAVLGECTFGLTRDFSSRGMALIISRHFPRQQVIVGIWPVNELMNAGTTSPGFLVGEIRSQSEIGAAFYKVGIELQQLLDEQHPAYEKLYNHAKCLLPPEQLRLLRMAAVR